MRIQNYPEKLQEYLEGKKMHFSMKEGIYAVRTWENQLSKYEMRSNWKDSCSADEHLGLWWITKQT